jgi:hypothetical protein
VGHIITKGIVMGTFQYAEQNGYLKILIGQFWERKGMGGGQVVVFLVT